MRPKAIHTICIPRLSLYPDSSRQITHFIIYSDIIIFFLHKLYANIYLTVYFRFQAIMLALLWQKYI